MSSAFFRLRNYIINIKGFFFSLCKGFFFFSYLFSKGDTSGIMCDELFGWCGQGSGPLLNGAVAAAGRAGFRSSVSVLVRPVSYCRKCKGGDGTVFPLTFHCL